MPTSSGPYREDREMTDNGIGECARVERGTDDEAPHAQEARQEHVQAALLY
jgi:hypothetical protein